jgi:hypothetical protein
MKSYHLQGFGLLTWVGFLIPHFDLSNYRSRRVSKYESKCSSELHQVIANMNQIIATDLRLASTIRHKSMLT